MDTGQDTVACDVGVSTAEGKGTDKVSIASKLAHTFALLGRGDGVGEGVEEVVGVTVKLLDVAEKQEVEEQSTRDAVNSSPQKVQPDDDIEYQNTDTDSPLGPTTLLR